MASLNITYLDRVEYILEHKDFGPLVISEPIGWENDKKEYARVEDGGYDGMISKFSSNLIFVGDAVEYIKIIIKTYGPNTELILKRRDRHPQNNLWELSYLGYLDLLTYRISNNQIKLKFNASSLMELVKSRESEKVEVERLETLDGATLPELSTKLVSLEGRKIFLQSSLVQSEFNSEVKAQVESNAGNTRRQTVALTLDVETNQHQDIIQAPYYQATGPGPTGDIGMMFILNVDRDRTFDFNISGGLDAFFQQYENVQWCFYGICLTVYENGVDFNLKNRYFLHELRSPRINPFDLGAATGALSEGVLPEDRDLAYPQFTKPMSFNYVNTAFELKAGESVALEGYLGSDMYVSNNAGVRVYTQNVNINFKIKENSYFKPTTAKAILAHELGDRLVKIISSRTDAFYSEALGRTELGYAADGIDTGALNGYSHGMWIRNFDKLPLDDENKYKAFTTSFKDFIEHNRVVWNLSLGIEKIGFRERLRLEKRSFFYNRNITIHLGTYNSELKKYIYPTVNKLEEYVASDYHYSSIICGYDKGAENEEAMGLDEPNTKTTWNTAFTKAKNVYDNVSKYIAGSYPKEFIRRKPKEDYPTTDHQNDKEIFCHDLKRGLTSDVFLERKYQDDFELSPTGIFSPETATNLRLSPVNVLLRHGEIIGAGLIDKTKYIRYSSSEGNSKLTTKKAGANAYSENGDILVSDLKTPRIKPMWHEFEFEVDYTLLRQIEGSTVILGKTIPNFYGLCQYRIDENTLARGFLFNVKPNGKGKWKILTANI